MIEMINLQGIFNSYKKKKIIIEEESKLNV